jgi:DNA-binding PadR family transcriptional regulator
MDKGREQSKGRISLGAFEEHVLICVARQDGLAYAVSILEEIEQATGRSSSLGSIYPTLERLESKGLVESELGESTPERGGKPKRLYRITGAGELALSEAARVRQALASGTRWAGVPGWN